MSEEVKPATCEWCKRYIARHLDAYYYGFSATGVKEIDNILCSVASAGKAYHSTADWSEGGYPELIQKAASEAAARLDAERALNADMLVELQNLRDCAMRLAKRLEKEAVPGNQAVASMWLFQVAKADAVIAKAEGKAQ